MKKKKKKKKFLHRIIAHVARYLSNNLSERFTLLKKKKQAWKKWK